jgi:glycoside/pentoside/hexuronide:cation symporter, GPH family
VLLFRPPDTSDQSVLFAYVLVVSLVLDTFFTMLQIPTFALGAELSSDYQERTQIFALRNFFDTLGTIGSGFLPFAVALR